MGFYVNPENESKESFLKRMAVSSHRSGSAIHSPEWEEIPSDELPVILLDNGMFTAAGVGYSKEEYEGFRSDGRLIGLYIVKIADLAPVTQPNLLNSEKVMKRYSRATKKGE